MLRKWLDGIAAIAMISASVFVIWSTGFRASAAKPHARPERPLPSEPVRIEGVAFQGNRSAPVVITEFSDFQCPFCSKFSREILPELVRDYVDTGIAILAFRHFPLTNAHPFAQDAAIASTCAARQGRFWELHDLLFRSSATLSANTVREDIRAAGLGGPALESCLASKEVADQVANDVAAGQVLGVTGTPAILVGARLDDSLMKLTARIAGARPISEFRAAIDSIVNTKSNR